MVTVEEFKEACKKINADDVVDQIILTEQAAHVSADSKSYIKRQLASAYSVSSDDLHLWVVGSAKLGFSIAEKRKNGDVLQRYRPFGPISDIDIAIVSTKIFRLIWDDLCRYAHGKAFIPWDSGRLGDYMVYGWLRPDCFPRGPGLWRCDLWWEIFRRMSGQSRFERRAVRGALFHSENDLRLYQKRAIEECKRAEELLE